MTQTEAKQYIYIVQASKETTRCKIGKTGDLEQRLKAYNSMSGNSKENVYEYLFTCEVKNMTTVEKDLKEKYCIQREVKNREVYFYNSALFEHYVAFIQTHELFVKEIFLKKSKPKGGAAKQTTPTLEDRGMTPKDVMQKAKKRKNDEFYTRLEDIEKEIAMYDKEIWKDKTVFCNCDDAVDNDERRTSAFPLYFLHHFKDLELKKLICIHFSGAMDLFNQGADGYVFTKEGFYEIGKKEYPKRYNGSFKHPLSLKILREDADIVCTNPPFSLSADYWKTITESGKKFLIISNHTNVKNNAYIPYFINGQVWAGYNDVVWFLNYKKELVKASGYWFTNFEVKNRPRYKNIKIMPLEEIPAKYKKFDDSGTLVVDNNYIPENYERPFAVGVYPIVSGLLEKGYKYAQDKEYVPYIKGKRCFGRVLVQKA